MPFESLLLNLLNLGAYAAVIILAISLTKKLYGGRFTSALPYLVAGIFLLFGLAIFDTLFTFWFAGDTSLYLLQTSLQIIAVIAAVFLLIACYKLYLLKYATAGYLPVEEEEHG